MSETTGARERLEGRLSGRLALITGASRGIGRAAALAYAREGAELVLMARTVGALEELDDEIKAVSGRTATLVPHDLSKDADALDVLGKSIYERWGKLDILLANAGVLGPLSPVGHVPPRDWSQVMEVNLNANYRLIRSLDPLLRQSSAGRAIFLTTGAVPRPRAYWGPYAASKAGLEALVKCYADELGRTGVTAVLVDPGAVRTKMRAQAVPGEDPDTLPPPEDLAEMFVELALPATKRNGERVSFKDWSQSR